MDIDNKILQLQQEYLQELQWLKNSTDLDEKVKRACLLATNLTFNAAGIYFSKIIEDVFLELANTKTINCSKITHKEKTFLHVLTTAYTVGGHTRVVEKWIQQADASESHSVVILQQGRNVLPPLLEKYVHEKNGSLTLFKEKELLKSALHLRTIASEYEYIILHVHMDDPTAIVAFGNVEFLRPVLFYNHASHMFWLGKSICDKLLDIKYNDFITVHKRQINDAYRLGIPLEDSPNRNIERKKAREALNLPENKKILITAGSAQKFFPFCGKFIGNVLLSIVSTIKDMQVIVIGADAHSEDWKNIRDKSNGSIINIPKVDYHKEYFLYINAADVVLDSWPMAGWTVVIDALTHDIPVLALSSPFGSSDYIENTEAFCKSEADLIEKIEHVLQSSDFKQNMLNDGKTAMLRDISSNAWKNKIKNLLTQIPQKHSVTPIHSEQESLTIDDWERCLFVIYNRLHTTRKFMRILRLETNNHLKHKKITIYMGKTKLFSCRIDLISKKSNSYLANTIMNIHKYLR